MAKYKYKPAESKTNEPSTTGPIDPNRAHDGISSLNTALHDDSVKKRVLNRLDRMGYSQRAWLGIAWVVLALSVGVAGVLFDQVFAATLATASHLLSTGTSGMVTFYTTLLPSRPLQVGTLMVAAWIPAIPIGLLLYRVTARQHYSPTLDAGFRAYTAVGADGEPTHVLETETGTPEATLRGVIDSVYDGHCKITPAEDWTPSDPRASEDTTDLELISCRFTFAETKPHGGLRLGTTVDDLEEQFEEVGSLDDRFVSMLDAYGFPGVLVVDGSPRANQTSLKQYLQDRERTAPENVPGQQPTPEQDRGRAERSAGAQARDEDLAEVEADQIIDLNIRVAVFVPRDQVSSATALINDVAEHIEQLVPPSLSVKSETRSTVGRFRLLSRWRAERDFQRIKTGQPGAEYTHPKRLFNTITRQRRVNYPVDPAELPVYLFASADPDHGTTPVPEEQLPPGGQADSVSEHLGVATEADVAASPGQPDHTDSSGA